MRERKLRKEGEETVFPEMLLSLVERPWAKPTSKPVTEQSAGKSVFRKE